MFWGRYLARAERIELALTRWRERLLPEAHPAPARFESAERLELRLFPIVGRDVCYPVTALLARGKLEEAGKLVHERAWVASRPLYG